MPRYGTAYLYTIEWCYTAYLTDRVVAVTDRVCTDEARRDGAKKCRELPVSVECPVSAHHSTLAIKRAVYRTKSANRSRDYSETDISDRVRELCPRQSTCRFDLATRDVTRARTTQRVARRHGNHIDISYNCQSTASAIIQPTDYRPGAQHKLQISK